MGRPTLCPDHASVVLNSGMYKSLLSIVLSNIGDGLKNSCAHMPLNNVMVAAAVLGRLCSRGPLAALYYRSDAYKWIVEFAGRTYDSDNKKGTINNNRAPKARKKGNIATERNRPKNHSNHSKAGKGKGNVSRKKAGSKNPAGTGKGKGKARK